MHPADYVLSAIGAKIQQANDSLITQAILNYVQNSKGDLKIKKEDLTLYEVHRQGEAQAISQFEVNNRRLLFHGSSLFNFIGILSEGLKICPPHNMINGDNFGPGLYFTDSLKKAANYNWNIES